VRIAVIFGTEEGSIDSGDHPRLRSPPRPRALLLTSLAYTRRAPEAQDRHLLIAASLRMGDASTIRDLTGCSPEQLRQHIEAQF